MKIKSVPDLFKIHIQFDKEKEAKGVGGTQRRIEQKLKRQEVLVCLVVSLILSSPKTTWMIPLLSQLQNGFPHCTYTVLWLLTHVNPKGPGRASPHIFTSGATTA